MSTTIGPSIWVVSDGRAGIEKQALALAMALGDMDRWSKLLHIRSTAHRTDPIRITPGAPQLWLPPDRWFDPMGALPRSERAVFKPPWPTLWIGSGRRTVPYSMRVKQWSEGETLVVQTQDPKTSPDQFDLIIPPFHDMLLGPNVFPIIGAPAYFQPSVAEEAALSFPELAAMPGKKRVGVIIGGKSKSHDLPPERAAEIEADLTRLAGQGFKLWISVSRRTPEDARIRFRAMAEKLGSRFFESEAADGPNPYQAFLSLSDFIIVTEDSSNMLSEAAWFGKPLYIMRLVGEAPKFKHFHDSLVSMGYARWFEGKLTPFKAVALREADRAADKIVELLLARHPQPALT